MAKILSYEYTITLSKILKNNEVVAADADESFLEMMQHTLDEILKDTGYIVEVEAAPEIE